MNLLVTLDGSELSEAILPAIQPLFECANVIALLSVLDPRDIGILAQYPMAGGQPPPANEPRDAATERIQREIGSRLEELAASIRRPGVEVETVVRIGGAVEVITGEARSRGIDLIAMATHGRSGLAEQILGSVSSEVLRAGVAPVVLVRPGLKPG